MSEYENYPREVLEGMLDLARARIAELAKAVPEGHVVVPVEPTEAMVDAAYNIEWRRMPSARSGCVTTYRAMIAAAIRALSPSPAAPPNPSVSGQSETPPAAEDQG